MQKIIRYLNATDSNELNNYNKQNSFSFCDDSDYQNKIEQVYNFRVKKYILGISERSYMMNITETG